MTKVIRAWDIETTVAPGNGRKASPFNPANWVVAMAWADYDPEGFTAGGQKVQMTPVTHRYWAFKDRAEYDKAIENLWEQAEMFPEFGPPKFPKESLVYPGDGWFEEVLEGVDILCGANIKFDLQHALYNKPKNQEAYWAWVAKGGRIWDILQAEYILGYATPEVQFGGEFSSLEGVASRYGGTAKLDQVKAMWAQGVDTPSIPKDILLEYLCGRYDEETCEHGDIGNTLLAAIAQMKEAQKRGKVRQWLKVEMLYIQALADMEMNGLYMDREKAEELREESLKKAEEARAALLSYLPEEFRDCFSFSSLFHKSAYLYGGTVKAQVEGWQNKDGEWSRTRWPEGQQAYAQMDAWEFILDKDGNKIPTTAIRGAHEGFRARKVKVDDPSKPKFKKSLEVTVTLPRLLDPPEGSEMAYEGVWSTAGEILEELPEKDPRVAALKELTLWEKDVKGSYWFIDPKGNKKGPMTFLGPDGLMHPSFQTNGTETTRLSAKSPNVQQISKRSDVKKAYTSRFPGGVIGQSDFCLSPDTPILTGDFEYLPAEKIQVGQELVGFDEFPEEGTKLRRFQRAFVTGVKRLVKPGVRIHLEDGTHFDCSSDHQWLSTLRGSPQRVWVAAEDLIPNISVLTQAVEHWETAKGEDAAWIRGMMDGEGWVSSEGETEKSVAINHGCNWGIAQSPKGDNALVCEELRRAFEACGDPTPEENRASDDLSYFRFAPGIPRPGWYAVGKYRPVRLLAKLKRCWPGESVRSKFNRVVRVTAVEPLGDIEVIAIETTTRTLIARGYLSHNCSLEMYVAQWLSGDEGLADVLGKGKDIHCLTVSVTKGIPYEEVMARKEAGDPEIKRLRQEAKEPRFAMTYGAGVKKIAWSTGLPEADVQAIMDADKQMFPGYYAFIEQLMAHLNANKVPTGEPRVHPLDPTQRWQPAIATWEAPYGLTFGWETEPSPQFALDKGITESIKPTKAKNYSVQGTGSSANKCAGVAAFLYRAHHPEYRRVLPSAPVHDANYWDIPADLIEPGVALLQASMMVCNNVLQALGLNTRVAVPAVTTYGPCWKELEGDKTVDKDGPLVVQFTSELTSKLFLKEIFK